MERKPWRKRSQTEINRNKSQHCRGCLYLSKTSANISEATCDYILMERKRRGCCPIGCDKYTTGRMTAQEKLRKQGIIK